VKSEFPSIKDIAVSTAFLTSVCFISALQNPLFYLGFIAGDILESNPIFGRGLGTLYGLGGFILLTVGLLILLKTFLYVRKIKRAWFSIVLALIPASLLTYALIYTLRLLLGNSYLY